MSSLILNRAAASRTAGEWREDDYDASLGFRVGNPSAIGWHQRVNFPASLLPQATSRRIATRRFAPKNGQSPSRSVRRRTRLQPTGRGRNIPRGGVVFSATHPSLSLSLASPPCHITFG